MHSLNDAARLGGVKTVERAKVGNHLGANFVERVCRVAGASQ